MKHFFYLLLFMLCMVTSCKVAYVPNTVNVPLFDDSGQLRLSGDTKGNFQFATSLDRHVGVMVNALLRQDGKDSDPVNGKGNFFEAGVGAFSGGDRWVTWETYVGAGIGKTKFVDNGKSFDTRGARFFFQPSIGIHHSIFEIAATGRLVGGRYSGYNTTYTTQELINNNLADIDKHTWLFAEPALTARVGYRWVKLQLQVGKAFKLTDKPLAFEENFSSIGLIFDFGRTYSF